MQRLNEWTVRQRSEENIYIISRYFQALLHQSIVKSHQLRVFVILEHQLARTKFGALPQQNFCAQVALQLFDCFPDVGVHVNL